MSTVWQLQAFTGFFPSFSSLESVAHQAAHLSQGFRDRAKRKSLTSGLLSLYTSYSNNLFPHLFASKKGQQHVIVHSSAHVSHPPILVSSGSVSWQICHHMSPFTHAEIDTLESAAKFRSTTRRPSNGRIAQALPGDIRWQASNKVCHRILGK